MDDDTETRGPGFEDQRDLRTAPARNQAIEGFLPEQGLVVVWGAPGANKSLLVLSWLSACANVCMQTTGSRQNVDCASIWPGKATAGSLTGQRRDAWRRYYRYDPVEIDGLKTQHYGDLADRDASLRSIDLFSPAGRERLAKMIELETDGTRRSGANRPGNRNLVDRGDAPQGFRGPAWVNSRLLCVGCPIGCAAVCASCCTRRRAATRLVGRSGLCWPTAMASGTHGTEERSVRGARPQAGAALADFSYTSTWCRSICQLDRNR